MASPLMFARGPWKVSLPFTVLADQNYTCIADRSFREMEGEGIGVYEQVYQPVGLSQEQCETDRVNAVTIVTLELEGKPNVLIPTSYITSSPTVVSEGFSRVVLALDIGILSDKVPLDHLKESLKQAAQDITGQAEAKVELFLAPYSGIITPDKAELMERNRLALLKNGTNQYAENKRLTDLLAIEQEKVKRLEKIIIDHAIPTA